MKKTYLCILKIIVLSLFFINSNYANNNECIDEIDICNHPYRYLKEIYKDEDLVIIPDIKYSPYKDFLTNRDLTFDFYSPRETCSKRPVVVIVHGGGFTIGNKYEFFDEAKAFARKGYAVVAINYRLMGNPLGTIPSIPNYTTLCSGGTFNNTAWYWAIQDLNASLKFISLYSSNLKIDPNQIFIHGESAGAITALQLAYTSQEEIEIAYPDVNFNLWFLGDIDNSTFQPAKSKTYTIKGVSSAFGAFVNKKFADQKKDIPLIMLHNACEELVPFNYGASGFSKYFSTPCEIDLFGSKYIYDNMNGAPHKLYMDCATWPFSSSNGLQHFGDSSDGNKKGRSLYTINFLDKKVPRFFYEIINFEESIQNEISPISSEITHCNNEGVIIYECSTEPEKLNTEPKKLNIDRKNSNSSFYESVNELLEKHPYNITERTNLIAVPNPVYDKTTINLSKWIGHEVKINIFSINGDSLLSKKLIISPTNSNYQIEASNWPTGVYFITINTSTVSKTIKILKK